MTKLKYTQTVKQLMGYSPSDHQLDVILECHRLGVSPKGCYEILGVVAQKFVEKK